MHNALGALSPLDGRYSDSVKELNAYFSEAALMRYRIYVELSISWLEKENKRAPA